jgi:hypothetical protein
MARLADDFAAIQTRLQELRGGRELRERRPAEAFMREDIDAGPSGATGRYPQHVMDATIRLLNELARRGQRLR